MKKLLMGLHLLVGFGAIAGGLGAVMNPTMPMGMSTDALKLGPFDSFLIPGLFLMLIIGVGNVISGIILFKKHPLWVYFSGFEAVALVLWIVIQCIILQSIVALHVIFFTFGMIQGLIALYYFTKDTLKLSVMNR